MSFRYMAFTFFFVFKSYIFAVNHTIDYLLIDSGDNIKYTGQ